LDTTIPSILFRNECTTPNQGLYTDPCAPLRSHLYDIGQIVVFLTTHALGIPRVATHLLDTASLCRMAVRECLSGRTATAPVFRQRCCKLRTSHDCEPCIDVCGSGNAQAVHGRGAALLYRCADLRQ